MVSRPGAKVVGRGHYHVKYQQQSTTADLASVQVPKVDGESLGMEKVQGLSPLPHMVDPDGTNLGSKGQEFISQSPCDDNCTFYDTGLSAPNV